MRNRWVIGGVTIGVAAAVLLAGLSYMNGRTAELPDLSAVPSEGKTLGVATAPVLVEVFSDYQCPYCGTAARGFEKDLAKEYIAKGQARLQFRDYPFIGLESYWASIAAGCAANQNQFWAYHDKLFAEQKGENQNQFSKANLKQWAKDLNLDMAAFNRCFDNEEPAASVRADYQLGTERGVNSTPTFFINGEKFVGILSQQELKKKMNKELAKVK